MPPASPSGIPYLHPSSYRQTNGMAQRTLRGMEFVCDQEWDAMEPIEGGRFCQACQQPVIDFTGMSKEELIAYFRSKPFTCGQYEPHQVDPSLIPIENLGKGVRRGLFASIAALGLNAAHAQVPHQPASTEQVVQEPQPSDAIEGTCVRPGRRGRGQKVEGEKAWTVQHRRRPSNRHWRVYVSGHFPFVHVEPYYIRGRRMRW